MSVSDPPLIVFTHIGCTGGAAFGNLLDAYFWQYQSLRTKLYVDHAELPGELERRADRTASLIDEYRRRQNAIRVVRGHFHVPYDRRDIWQRPVRYVTFLRDPVRRFISHQGYRVTDFDKLAALKNKPEVDFNLQTTYLSGCDSLCASEKDLALAKKNITGYSFVGITEEFDKSVELFTKTEGLPFIGWWHEKRTVTKTKPSIPEAVQDEIRRLAWMDVELYDLAKTQFSEQLARYDSIPLRGPRLSERIVYPLRKADFHRSRAVRQLRRIVLGTASPARVPV